MANTGSGDTLHKINQRGGLGRSTIIGNLRSSFPMPLAPALQYPGFHDKLVRDVEAKTKASLALIGQVAEIGAAIKAKDAALARLEAFNRGDLIPDAETQAN
jgi:hypothetical protein